MRIDRRPLSRRNALRACAGGALLSGCDGRQELPPTCEDDPLDSVLDAFHQTDPEFAGGLSNHGPMAAEALAAQGRADRICAWSQDYVGQLDPLPAAAPLTEAEQPAALGDPSLRAAWVATWVQRLSSGQLEQHLAEAWPSLLPGYAAAAMHGPLRTGHALRGLAQKDSPVRRTEVAHGLAHWAARHLLLPGVPGDTPIAGNDVVQALASVPVLPASEQLKGGFVHARIAAILGNQAFADAVALVDLLAFTPERTLTELAAAAARLYVADPHRGDLGYLHAVTGTSVLRLMLPWMEPAIVPLALGYAFQAVAAVHATHASAPGVPADTYAPATDVEALSAEGQASNDEHTIKLVEALLREYAEDPRPELLVAAELRLGA